jgi:hypothetical protein
MHQFLKFILGIKLYMFRTVPPSIIRSFSLYTQQWCISYRLQIGPVWHCSSILILLASCQQNCMTYTIAVCTVKNSWLWTEELQFHPDLARKLSAKLYDIYHCCVYSEKLLIMDRGTAVLTWSCSLAVSKTVWHIPLLCVSWKTPDDGQRNCSSILILLASCQQTCMTYTIAVCTVKNSWLWTEKLSETCRISFQEKISEISASSWFYCKKFNTMQGHMNIKLSTYNISYSQT